MQRLSEFIALSPLPIWCRWDVGERLRAGDSPGAMLDRLLAKRWTDQPDKRSAVRSRATAALARATERGLSPLAWSDPAYPPALATIVHPPPVLWARGLPAALERPGVAIVGSRAASPYALEVAGRLAADLALGGIAIVSGLARGVDSPPHDGALSVAGSTIAVLGSGADVVYPPEHAALAREIEPAGLVMSKLVPGTRPLPQFFPQRNRIISGLSRRDATCWPSRATC